MQKSLEYYLSLDYPVEIRKIDDSLGGGYVASIPSLGSQAFVGDGDTPQEAYENLQAAKKEVLAEYLEHGVSIPEPVDESEYEGYSGKLVVRMPRELHARLAAAAKRNDSSLNQFIVYALGSFEAKWNVVEEVRQAAPTVRANRSTWCGTGSPPAGKGLGEPASTEPYRAEVSNVAPVKLVPATVLSRTEATKPAVVVSGLERSTPWSSTLPSSVTTLTLGTS